MEVGRVTCELPKIYHFRSITVSLNEDTVVEDIVMLKNALLASPTFEKCSVIINGHFDFPLLQLLIGIGRSRIYGSNASFQIKYGQDCVQFEKFQ